MKVFDLHAFLELIDGDKSLFQELVILFQRDWPELVVKLRLNLGKKDVKEIEKIAHRIRGLCKNFFSNAPANLAETIEVEALEGQLPTEEAVQTLEKYLKELEGALLEALKQTQ